MKHNDESYAHDEWCFKWACLKTGNLRGHSIEELHEFVISIQVVAQNTYHDDMEVIIQPSFGTVSIHHKYEDEFPAIGFTNSDELWDALIEMAKKVKEDCIKTAEKEWDEAPQYPDESDEEYKYRWDMIRSFVTFAEKLLGGYLIK